jgi:site-specific DNA recombinase
MTYNDARKQPLPWRVAMRVVVYCRVSTADQADNGVSLQAQQAKLEAYANLYDLEVTETITDAGESAKSLNRPGLKRALAMLRKGEADGLLVAKLDRLTRSVADWQTLIDGYFGEKAGKQLFSLSDSIDTRTAAGRMVLNMLLVVSQWEREIIGERTRDALRHKIRKGQRVGKVLYGYDLANDGKTLVANEAEQQTIGLIKQLRANGYSLEKIATELSERGIPTKAGLNNWIHTAVRRILNRQNKTAA